AGPLSTAARIGGVDTAGRAVSILGAGLVVRKPPGPRGASCALPAFGRARQRLRPRDRVRARRARAALLAAHRRGPAPGRAEAGLGRARRVALARRGATPRGGRS